MTTHVPDTTAALSNFVSGTRFSSLPSEVVESLTWFMLDGVANVLAGSRTAIARHHLRFLRPYFSGGDAPVLGTDERATLPFAAYLAATAANQLDFDDTYVTFAHPGATATGPALVIGSTVRSSGADVLAAVAVGYETQVRVMSAGLPTPDRRRIISGFGTWQGLGTAAVAGSLLGLDADRMRHAFSLAAFNAPVPNFPKLGLGTERPGASVKNNYGWSAMGGVLGTLMARDGFRGNERIFDGPSGFATMAGSDRWDAASVLEGLGTDWRFTTTSPKPYAACRWAHSALDGAGQIVVRLEPGETAESVVVRGFGNMVTYLAFANPVDLVDAQFSLPYLVSLELLGRSTRHGISDADLADPAVMALAQRVQLEHDPAKDAPFDAGRMEADVIVRTSAGRELVASVDDAWSTALHPYSRDDSWRKFVGLVSPVLGESAALELGERILNLPAEADITTITDLCTAPVDSTAGAL